MMRKRKTLTELICQAGEPGPVLARWADNVRRAPVARHSRERRPAVRHKAERL